MVLQVLPTSHPGARLWAPPMVHHLHLARCGPPPRRCRPPPHRCRGLLPQNITERAQAIEADDLEMSRRGSRCRSLSIGPCSSHSQRGTLCLNRRCGDSSIGTMGIVSSRFTCRKWGEANKLFTLELFSTVRITSVTFSKEQARLNFASMENTSGWGSSSWRRMKGSLVDASARGTVAAVTTTSDVSPITAVTTTSVASP